MCGSFLRPNEGQYFGFCVNSNAKPFFIPSRDRLTEGSGTVEEEVAVGGRVGE